MEGLQDKGGGIVLFLHIAVNCAVVGVVVEDFHLLCNLQKFK